MMSSFSYSWTKNKTSKVGKAVSKEKKNHMHSFKYILVASNVHVDRCIIKKG